MRYIAMSFLLALAMVGTASVTPSKANAAGCYYCGGSGGGNSGGVNKGGAGGGGAGGGGNAGGQQNGAGHH